ncbi:hypothetical protein GF322_00085 [Candidatus Dependentiae bacterium]|nr:hypothetical protein [Candidatus Dependentiae bacterium]
MFENINFYNDEIIFNDLYKDTILFLEEMEIKEKDLLFVKYPSGLVLDVDWHNSIFFVSIIQNDDWDNQIVKRRCKSLNELKIALKDCIFIIKKMSLKRK